MYNRYFKRLLDILLSGMGLIVLCIPMLIVAIITKLDTKGPALFKQERMGIHKKPFYILKFRSMPTTVDHYKATSEFGQVNELTKWELFIRKTSLDELPQLINIFMGDMSVVGPRPALRNQTELLAQRDLYGANDIVPGLTGWAQINGRDELPDDVKARFDGEYVEQRGFRMDCRCFFGTITKVLTHEGVVEGGPQK